ARVPVGHIHDVALLPDAGHVGSQDHPHLRLAFFVGANCRVDGVIDRLVDRLTGLFIELDIELFGDLDVGGTPGPVSAITTVTAVAPRSTRAAFGDGALRIRQQRQLARRLDGYRHVALVLGAVTGYAPSADLAAVA